MLGVIYNDDCLNVLPKYEDSINLVVTSPPYNLSIKYDKYEDNKSYYLYLSQLQTWLFYIYKSLKSDGRACFNIPLTINKNGNFSFYSDFIKIAESVGFNFRTSIIWLKNHTSKRTAWGSWLSASSPNVIAPVEMIVVMYKERWKRLTKGTTTITKDEFISWTNGVWNIAPESVKKVQHPAPFPIELPERCIKLFSYKEDIILYPFLGSGTTALACEKLNRKYVGIELSKNYYNLTIQRLSTKKQHN